MSLFVVLLLHQTLLVLCISIVFALFNSRSLSFDCGFWKPVESRVFLFILEEFAGCAECLSIVFCGVCQGVILRVLAAVVSCSWGRFLVNNGEKTVLCLMTPLPWITPFYYYYHESKNLFCVCTHAYYCATLPNLSLAPLWPVLNCCLPIFSSSPPSIRSWVSFHLALCISPHRLSVLLAIPRLWRNVSTAPLH